MWHLSTPTTLLVSASLMHRSLAWAFIWGLWTSGFTYFHSLSCPSLGLRPLPPSNRTALDGESKVFSFVLPSPRSQWWIDHMCCTTPSSSRFWTLFSSHNRNKLDWQSNGQAAFLFSVTVPDGKKTLSKREAGKQQENKWSRHGLQSYRMAASSCMWLKWWTSVNLRQSLSDMRIWILLWLLLTPSLTCRKCTRRKPQAGRTLGVSFVLWPAATLLQHSGNNPKPAIKAKFKQLKQIMNTGPGLT